MAMFSQAATAFITEQQASRFLEECLIGSAVFDKHPEEMNFSPHVWTSHPHCVQHTIGKHLSHCLCLAVLNCCVPDGRLQDRKQTTAGHHFPDSPKINSRDKVSGFPPHLHFILMKSYPGCQQVCSICKS